MAPSVVACERGEGTSFWPADVLRVLSIYGLSPARSPGDTAARGRPHTEQREGADLSGRSVCTEKGYTGLKGSLCLY